MKSIGVTPSAPMRARKSPKKGICSRSGCQCLRKPKSAAMYPGCAARHSTLTSAAMKVMTQT